ncbi:cyclin-dependent kinase 12-like isoform X2 [Carassius auratus]|uniref:non-specific serine/threonine protein kinase n=1 Tax=Carassius auratus TaxID=7957 RepID=A0A6P6J668_CARAU|nr:cyclin-dependent kinase 12-like isoform X2 [Carassius auratus]
MENNPTEKASKHKNRFCAFFKKTWRAVKSGDKCRRGGNSVVPHQSVSDTDSADPQCGLSGLKPAAHWHLADPQPGPSGLEPTALQEQTDPPPRPSSVTPVNCDEEPADPEPAEENQANKKKKKHICAFFKRAWRAVKRAATQQKKHNKVAPLCPQLDTDSADYQPDPNIIESTALQDLTDLQPDPNIIESTALQDLADLQPDPNIIESTALQDLADLQPDPNIIESTALQDLTDLQLDPNIIESTALQDLTDLQLDPNIIESTALQDLNDLQLDPNIIESTALQDLNDLQPDPNIIESTALQDLADLQPDPNIIESTALQDLTDLQLDPNIIESTALQDLTDLQLDPNIIESTALQDLNDLQLDPNIPESTALQEPVDPPEDPQSGSSEPDQDPDVSERTAVVGAPGLVAVGLQDPADPLPGPSALDPVTPKFPGASKHRRITDQTHFRAACFTDPTPVPFDEIYEVGEEIGEGGFGTVYEGISKFLREQVAIKFIPKCETDRYIEIPGCSKPLFAEVALNLLLKRPPLSPYIVHMLEWFEEDDQFILILEYPQPCKDLLKFMVNNMQRVNESQTRRLMYQAVLGAKHCLDRGVFHRDIKLNNFLINTNTNQVKLIDFGCGDLVKTSGYLGDFTGVCPPEYYKDLKYEAGPTTVWSLGKMMYTMVCRCQPFNSLEDMMHGRLSFNISISTELQDLISRCLAYHPTERATIEEILQHEWFQQGQMLGVAQDQIVTDAPKWPR